MVSDSRTWRTSSQAEPSTLAPFHIIPASTSTTAEFSAAIDRMRQRIGTARTTPTILERTRVARLTGRSSASCRGSAKVRSLRLANAVHQRGHGWVALGLAVDRRQCRLERLAVELCYHRHSSRSGLLTRLLLKRSPFFTHEQTGADRGLPEDLAILD